MAQASFVCKSEMNQTNEELAMPSCCPNVHPYDFVCPSSEPRQQTVSPRHSPNPVYGFSSPTPYTTLNSRRSSLNSSRSDMHRITVENDYQNQSSTQRTENWFAAEFVNSSQWKPSYQRNNRNGGMKNIRCFPHCGPKHYTSGFCGESLLLKVKTTTSNDLFAYAQIALARPNTAAQAGGSPMKVEMDGQKSSPLSIEIGNVVNEFVIKEKLRTRDNPFREWWNGDLRETKEVLTDRGTSNERVERQLAFEFNRSKRGWHYGWVANKYISDSMHVVRAFLFVPVAGNMLKCVHIAESPQFRLYSRKPKRESVASAKISSNPKKKARNRQSSHSSSLSTLPRCSSLPEGTMNAQHSLPQQSSFGLNTEELDSSDVRMATNENGQQTLTTPVMTNNSSPGSAFVGISPVQKNHIGNHSIGSDWMNVLDDFFLPVPYAESIVNDLSDKFRRKEGMANFKGQNVFKMLQNILLLSKEDFGKFVNNSAAVQPSGGSGAQYKEIVALRAFAAFLLSDEEDVTAEIQAKMDNLNPFEQNDQQLEESKQDDSMNFAQDFADSQKKGKTDELMKLAKNKFDKFLATFNLNVDKYTKFNAKGNRYDEPEPEAKFINEKFMPTFNNFHASKQTFACQQDVGNNSSRRGSLTSSQECGSDRCKKRLLCLDSEEINDLLDNLSGGWQSSSVTLEAYDRMYDTMSVPYALRKCYLCITGSFVVSTCSKAPRSTSSCTTSSDEEKEIDAVSAPSIISQYNPKLFSTGAIKYTFDGMKYPWPLASPLISTKYDAVSIRAFITFDLNNKLIINLEHFYRGFKMLRSMKFSDSNFDQLVGEVKLFERWTDLDGESIEWSEVQRNEISFTRVNVNSPKK